MTEYHTVYKGPEGETTQWEDIQARLGNLPAKPKAWRPDPYAPPQDEEERRRGAAWLDAKRDEGALEEAEDELDGDDRALEAYRRKRIAELRAAAARPRFGTLEAIAGNEFVQKVTDASDRGQWVVCLLERQGHEGCALLAECLTHAAARYTSTRFVRAAAASVIPNYPDANLPTLLVYQNRACAKTLVGLAAFGGRRATPETVAMALNAAVGPGVCAELGDDDDGGGGGGGGGAATAEAQVRQLVERVVAEREQRGGGGGGGRDESSDFSD